MSPSTDPPDAEAIHAFASGCQTLAGILRRRDTSVVIERLEQLAATVPHSETFTGHLATSAIVAGLCTHVARTYDIPTTSVTPVTPNCAPRDLSQALLSLVDHLPGRRTDTIARTDARVTRMCRLMEVSIERPLAIAELARQVGLSASRAQHLFQEQMGTSIGRHFRDLRLQRAASVLRDPAIRISDVAYGVGFSGLPQFDRAFKRRFGMVPSAYRHSS
jgi:AraC-like DNA-binding protein